MGKVIIFPPSASNERTATPSAGGIFVGRERELEELRTGLEETCAGRGRLILLVGEPGVGKTSTANKLAAIVRQRCPGAPHQHHRQLQHRPGVNALYASTTGGNNLALGYKADSNLTTGSNNIAIGNPGVAGEANTLRLGST
jgi:hypothetical protein